MDACGTGLFIYKLCITLIVFIFQFVNNSYKFNSSGILKNHKNLSFKSNIEKSRITQGFIE
jgi:hypothetical protein